MCLDHNCRTPYLVFLMLNFIFYWCNVWTITWNKWWILILLELYKRSQGFAWMLYMFLRLDNQLSLYLKCSTWLFTEVISSYFILNAISGSLPRWSACTLSQVFYSILYRDDKLVLHLEGSSWFFTEMIILYFISSALPSSL